MHAKRSRELCDFEHTMLGISATFGPLCLCESSFVQSIRAERVHYVQAQLSLTSVPLEQQVFQASSLVNVTQVAACILKCLKCVICTVSDACIKKHAVHVPAHYDDKRLPTLGTVITTLCTMGGPESIS